MIEHLLEHKDDRDKSMLCMVPYFGWMIGLIFLITEKSHVVRWYALQGVYFLMAMVLAYVFVLPLMRMTMILIPLTDISQGIVGIGYLVVSLAGCLQVHSGKPLRIPVIADLVDASFKRRT